jgi:hypothetical protein
MQELTTVQSRDKGDGIETYMYLCPSHWATFLCTATGMHRSTTGLEEREFI